MAAKKSKREPRKPKHGAKAAFVRDLPGDMPAKEVVEKAAAKGLKLSVGHVHNIRSTSKAKPLPSKRGRPPLGRGRHAVLTSKGGFESPLAVTAPHFVRSSGDETLEREFERFVVKLGTLRARKMLDALEA